MAVKFSSGILPAIAATQSVSLDDPRLVSHVRTIRNDAIALAILLRMFGSRYQPGDEATVLLALKDAGAALAEGWGLLQLHDRDFCGPHRAAVIFRGEPYTSFTEACFAIGNVALRRAWSEVQTVAVGSATESAWLADLTTINLEGVAEHICQRGLRLTPWIDWNVSRPCPLREMITGVRRESWEADREARRRNPGSAPPAPVPVIPANRPAAPTADYCLAVRRSIRWQQEAPAPPLLRHLLQCLLEAQGRPVAFTTLEETVWNREVADRRISNAVSDLNKTLEAIGFPWYYATKEGRVHKDGPPPAG